MNEMAVRDSEMGVRQGEAAEVIRTPEIIGAEIRMYIDTARRVGLLCGIEVGRRLTEAKEMLDHGEWLPWLKRETSFTDRSAQRYMQLFDEYGAAQMGLFGPETNATTLSDLPISKALALLSIPESEREEFAAEVDAEHIPVRQLKEEIRKRTQAEEDRRHAEEELEKYRQSAASSATAMAEKNKKLQEQEFALTKAEQRIKALKKQNQELESRPTEVAVETVRDEEAIREAVREAEEKANGLRNIAVEAARKESQKELEELRKKLEKAEKDMETARTEVQRLKGEAEKAGQGGSEELEEAKRDAALLADEIGNLKKRLAASDAEMTKFGVHFEQLQKEFAVMEEIERTVRRDKGDELADRLGVAVVALLDQMKAKWTKEGA